MKGNLLAIVLGTLLGILFMSLVYDENILGGLFEIVKGTFIETFEIFEEKARTSSANWQ